MSLSPADRVELSRHIVAGLAIADAHNLVDVGIYLDRARVALEECGPGPGDPPQGMLIVNAEL